MSVEVVAGGAISMTSHNPPASCLQPPASSLLPPASSLQPPGCRSVLAVPERIDQAEHFLVRDEAPTMH
jgi:hypothetical protein